MSTFTFRSEAQHLRSIAAQARFAAAGAINDVLFAARRAEQAEIMRAFDRPTPYVQRGVTVRMADKATLSGAVEISHYSSGAAQGGIAGATPPGKVVQAEVYGGMRRWKRSEVLWNRLGLLPAGWFTVPGKAARRDSYGNVTRGQILHLLSWFSAHQDKARKGGHLTDRSRKALRRGTARRAGVEYFAIKPGERTGGLRPGIYERQLAGGRFVGPARRPRAVLLFVSRASYREALRFHSVAADLVAKQFDGRYTQRFASALRTAR